jgi:hypothetical protein
MPNNGLLSSTVIKTTRSAGTGTARPDIRCTAEIPTGACNVTVKVDTSFTLAAVHLPIRKPRIFDQSPPSNGFDHELAQSPNQRVNVIGRITYFRQVRDRGNAQHFPTLAEEWRDEHKLVPAEWLITSLKA